MPDRTEDGWTASAEEAGDRVTAFAAGALHDLLDRDGPAPVDGVELPLLWHWLAFLPRVRQEDLGPDGHPRTGGFLPPTQGRRRMYAGGRVDRSGSVRVGDPLHRVSRVSDVRTTSGRSGQLMFVTVDHVVTGPDLHLSERTDLVYREPTSAARTEPDGDDTGWAWGRQQPVDPTLLFRFSALTYNAHRIHYDREYATTVEGYPGLVVQGPLQALLLADAVERVHPGRALTRLDFRALAPAFDGDALDLRLRPGPGPEEVEVAAFSAGRRTMEAVAVLAPETAR